MKDRLHELYCQMCDKEILIGEADDIWEIEDSFCESCALIMQIKSGVYGNINKWL